jgi:hypothetical protein
MPVPISTNFSRPEKHVRDAYTRENPPPYEVISKKAEYWAFVEWSATFKPVREPKSQRDLAEKLGVDPSDLSHWKLMPQWANDVRSQVKRLISSEDYASAIHGWIKRLPAEGRVADIKYLNEWTGEFSTTKRLSHTIVDSRWTQGAKEAEKALSELKKKTPDFKLPLKIY